MVYHLKVIEEEDLNKPMETPVDIKSDKLQKLHEKYQDNEPVEKIIERLKTTSSVDAGDVSSVVDLVKEESVFLKEKNFKSLKNEMEMKVNEFVEKSKQYFEDDTKIFDQESHVKLERYCLSKLLECCDNLDKLTTDEQFNKNSNKNTIETKKNPASKHTNKKN